MKTNETTRVCAFSTTAQSITVCNTWWWMTLLFPMICFLALIWFLIRVIPKPSRAAYPCQKVAMPMAFTFLIWLGSVTGSALAFRRALNGFRRARYIAGSVCIVISVLCIGWSLFSTNQPSFANYLLHATHPPTGIAQGYAPGRVAWTHDPDITDWLGPGTGQRWYDRVNQAVADDLMTRALRTYAGEGDLAAAWDAIFRHHNGDFAYQPGEKIMIKVNLTTSFAGSGTANIDDDYNWQPTGSLSFDAIGHCPQLLHALLDQLVNVVGVAQSDISIGDPTGLWINELYIPLHDDFPEVNYLDNYGAQDRTRADFSIDPLYWSTEEAAGAQQDFIVSAYAGATYLINFAILKSHNLGGITAIAKNHFGSLLRTPTGWLRGVKGNWLELHQFLPGNDEEAQSPETYRPIVDLNGHASIGGKTVLYLIDAVYGGKDWDATPSTWPMSPFNGDWPSSLFISMDPVAIDSVAFDFLAEQWPDHALMNEGVQDYLHEMALADNPPSQTIYDPENDGERLPSLGTHEHWNNATDKHYSRNRDDGDGIELLYIRVQAGDFESDNDIDGINLYDFMVAYATGAYPDADVNRDGFISAEDIAEFAESFGRVSH